MLFSSAVQNERHWRGGGGREHGQLGGTWTGTIAENGSSWHVSRRVILWQTRAAGHALRQYSPTPHLDLRAQPPSEENAGIPSFHKLQRNLHAVYANQNYTYVLYTNTKLHMPLSSLAITHACWVETRREHLSYINVDPRRMEVLFVDIPITSLVRSFQVGRERAF